MDSEKVFSETIAENFPNLRKDIAIRPQLAVLNRYEPKDPP